MVKRKDLRSPLHFGHEKTEAAYERARGQRGDMKATSNSEGKPGFLTSQCQSGIYNSYLMGARNAFRVVEADEGRDRTQITGIGNGRHGSSFPKSLDKSLIL